MKCYYTEPAAVHEQRKPQVDLTSVHPSKGMRRRTFQLPCRRQTLPVRSVGVDYPSIVCLPKRSPASNLKFLRMNSKTPASAKPLNVVQWLGEACPDDILPLVLAFVGPSTTSSLSKTCARWRQVLQQDKTWKVLSEELYKWKDGDEVPHSWKDHYRQNPIVPTDFSSVRRALKYATKAASQSQAKSIRVLCRPGKHYLSKAITFYNSDLAISIETLELPEASCSDSIVQPSRAVLVQCQSTRIRNEPALRVVGGTQVMLRNIGIHHSSSGSDIWNGNAAIHIYAPGSLPVDGAVKKASVTLQSVEISSTTGRGIVLAADGANLEIRDSCIHSCAGTGLFVAGDHTTTRVDSTDIVLNGRGNHVLGRVLAGHSGIFIEKGELIMSNCNVSTNVGCGITVLSPNDTRVKVTKSDVAMNGMDSLEAAFRGPLNQQAGLQNNSTSSAGERSRSGILKRAN